jgi:large subunit ribosomal protein L28
MSRVCQLTGKRPMKGHKVSHSNVKTNRRFLPNLFTKKFFMPETGQWVTLKVSMHALRTIDKKGLHAYLKELPYEGVNLGIKL